MFSSVRNHQTVFQMVVPFCIPISNSVSSCCSITSPALASGSVPDLGHSDRCRVISHCCLNLHFPDDIWCGGAFFHMLICHLYIFFHEVSVEVFGPCFQLSCWFPYPCIQSCPILCDPMDCSLLVSSVHRFSRQEYWSGLPCPPPGDLPDLELYIIFDCLTTLTSNILKS